MILISDKIVTGTGYAPTEDQTAQRADMCPDVSSKKKRLDSIKSAKYTNNYNNIPLPGFTIHKPTGSWGGHVTEWYVIDPRGFKTLITSENLAQIVSCSGITEGLIQEKCIWGYEGKENVLLPINSEPYKLATKNTDIVSTTVSLRDVQIGDKVILHDKAEGIYYGPWVFIDEVSSYPTKGSRTTSFIPEKRKYVFKYFLKDGSPAYLLKNNMKVSRIIKSKEIDITKEQIHVELLEQIFLMNNSMNDYYHPDATVAKRRFTWSYVKTDPKENVFTKLRERTVQEVKDKFSYFNTMSVHGKYFFAKRKDINNFYSVAIPYVYGGSSKTDLMHCKKLISLTEIDCSFELDSRNRYIDETFRLEDFETLYELEYVTTSKTFCIGD